MSARELAAQAREPQGRQAARRSSRSARRSLRGASLIDWSPAPQAIEVAQANPGLCAVLENAALLYANGQAAPARELLEQGVQTDADTKLSPLAWLALFDLLQRANDRDGVRPAVDALRRAVRALGARRGTKRVQPPADDTRPRRRLHRRSPASCRAASAQIED